MWLVLLASERTLGAQRLDGRLSHIMRDTRSCLLQSYQAFAFRMYGPRVEVQRAFEMLSCKPGVHHSAGPLESPQQALWDPWMFASHVGVRCSVLGDQFTTLASCLWSCLSSVRLASSAQGIHHSTAVGQTFKGFQGKLFCLSTILVKLSLGLVKKPYCI